MTTHKEALEAAYLAGFNASGEGYNGEYPFGDKMQDPAENRVWKKNRDNYIKEALAKLDKIAALQQKTESHDVDCLCSDCAALDDLDEALAQPEQKMTYQQAAQLINEMKSQPEQEPVAVYVGETWCGSVVRLYEDLSLETPLYTHPAPQRTWVGLTDEEIEEIFNKSAGYGRDDFRSFAQSIEAKLKEKNT